MDETHGIGVVIDSTGASAGEAATVRSLDHIKQAAEQAGASGAKAGEQLGNGFAGAGSKLDEAAAAMARLSNASAAIKSGDFDAIKRSANELGQAYADLGRKTGNTRIAQMEMMHVVRAGSDQFAAGAQPLQIFAMQIGRVAEAAAFMGPALGKVGEIMSGVWGLAIIAGTVLIAKLIEHLMKEHDALAAANDKLHEQAEKTRIADEAQKMFDQTLDGVESTIRKLSKAYEEYQNHLKTSNELSLDAARGALLIAENRHKEAQETLNAAKAELERNNALAIGAETKGHVDPRLVAADAARGRINAAQTELDRSQVDINVSQTQIDRFQAIVTAEKASLSQLDKIKDRYDQQVMLVTRTLTFQAQQARAAGDTAKAQSLVTDQLTKQVTALRDQQHIEEENYRKSQQRSRHNYDYETKDFSISEVKDAIGSGANFTSGHRSYEKQKQLYDAYIAYREGRGPFANVAAKPGTSDHESDHALDITGKSVAQVREAAQKAHIPIKQLFWEVDHVHFAWRKVGDATNDATRAAENQVKIEETRKLNEQAFWMTLQNEGKVAAMLPGEAEKYNKKLELQKILADGVLANIKALTPEQEKAVEAAVDLANKTKLIGDMQLAMKKVQIDQTHLLDQQAAKQGDTVEQTQDQLALEERMWPFKQKALELGIDLQDEAVKKVWDELEAREKTNLEIEKRNRLIDEGNQLVEKLNKEADPAAAAHQEYLKNLQRLGASTLPQRQKDKALEQLNKDYADQMRDINKKFFNEMMDNVHKIADGLGGALGDFVDHMGQLLILLDRTSRDLIESGKQQAHSEVGQIAQGLQGLTNNMNQIFAGGNSKFMQGLSSVLGQAASGAETGEQVAGIMKSLGWKKFSNTGSQIGGAAGSVIGTAIGGPIGGQIGSFIGSLIGGTIGSLFKKTKEASATVTSAYGDVSVTGKKAGGKYDTAATQMATAVQQGLIQISQTLGATLGEFAVSIGMRGDKYVVDEQGQGRTKGAGTPSFKTAEEAVAYAILDAIKDGALKGLSAATTRILKAATPATLDRLLQSAQIYEQLSKAAKNAANPMGAAFAEFVNGVQATMAQLKEAGYTYQELMALAPAFAQTQKQILEEMTSGYQDFLKELTSGASSGKTIYQQFLDAQASFQQMVASHSYTQDQFTESGQNLIDLAGKVYGTATPEYEQIKQSLIDATQQAIDDAQQAATDALNSAGIIAAIGDTNDILRAILDKIYGTNSGDTPTTGGDDTSTPPSDYTTTGGYGGGVGGSIGGGYGGRLVYRY